jgi:hypothetical protein
MLLMRSVVYHSNRWEITIIGRKLFLVCLSVFLANDVHTQSLLALLLVMILLVAHVRQAFMFPR